VQQTPPWQALQSQGASKSISPPKIERNMSDVMLVNDGGRSLPRFAMEGETSTWGAYPARSIFNAPVPGPAPSQLSPTIPKPMASQNVATVQPTPPQSASPPATGKPSDRPSNKMRRVLAKNRERMQAGQSQSNPPTAGQTPPTATPDTAVVRPTPPTQINQPAQNQGATTGAIPNQPPISAPPQATVPSDTAVIQPTPPTQVAQPPPPPVTPPPDAPHNTATVQPTPPQQVASQGEVQSDPGQTGAPSPGNNPQPTVFQKAQDWWNDNVMGKNQQPSPTTGTVPSNPQAAATIQPTPPAAAAGQPPPPAAPPPPPSPPQTSGML